MKKIRLSNRFAPFTLSQAAVRTVASPGLTPAFSRIGRGLSRDEALVTHPDWGFVRITSQSFSFGITMCGMPLHSTYFWLRTMTPTQATSLHAHHHKQQNQSHPEALHRTVLPQALALCVSFSSMDGSTTDTRISNPVTLLMACSMLSVPSAVNVSGRTVSLGIFRRATIMGRWKSLSGMSKDRTGCEFCKTV